MKTGPDIDLEYVDSRSIRAYHGKEKKRIGAGEIGNEYNARRYGIYATRKDRTEVYCVYEGQRNGSAITGLPLGGPNRESWDPTAVWHKASAFHMLTLDGEDE